MNNIALKGFEIGFKKGFEKEAQLLNPAQKALIALGVLGTGGALAGGLREGGWRGALRGGLKGVGVPLGAALGSAAISGGDVLNSALQGRGVSGTAGPLPGLAGAGFGGIGVNELIDYLLPRQR